MIANDLIIITMMLQRNENFHSRYFAGFILRCQAANYFQPEFQSLIEHKDDFNDVE